MWNIVSWTLSIVLVVAGIYLVIRPVLRASPRFAEFYAEADTFWQKVAAFGYNSATVALSYALSAIGFLTSQIDTLATLLGDPQIKQQIADMLGASPTVLGYVMMAIGVVTFVARMRSIVRG
ncbi:MULTISPECIES: hypothetical protein [Rhodopseudomonas]|uniref:Uncharacterized protein n=1 Tax=Rhodopseudomonas palustris TaxID=1076 RepID=A0A0D7F3J5_RHOPL|nr:MULTISPECIES: hypothetical protein [Rhodopseudomonas]KIZ47401.1 hypothetical protein OO17_04655 [Rhodopseudomonas palustris]MDF3809253.1 hypothetical protein [Rhodopseudomonas sp. BAL398]WOK19062.1 hypothetical protein RBJ75_05960 [Rhodopseudomonas sp. BAL398]